MLVPEGTVTSCSPRVLAAGATERPVDREVRASASVGDATTIFASKICHVRAAAAIKTAGYLKFISGGRSSNKWKEGN